MGAKRVITTEAFKENGYAETKAATEALGLRPCLMCGVAVRKNAKLVHLIDCGYEMDELINVDEVFEETVGMKPVCSGCAKHVRPMFLFPSDFKLYSFETQTFVDK